MNITEFLLLGTLPTLLASPLLARQEVLREHFTQTAFGLSAEFIEPLDDIDGDGVVDYFLSAFTADLGTIDTYSGATGDLLWSFRSPVGGYPVRWVSPAGDFNGDGVTDIVWSDAFSDIPHANAGELVFLSGLDGSFIKRIRGFLPGMFLGQGLAGVGDTNGDGYDDVLAVSDFGVYLFLGPDGQLQRDHFLVGSMAGAGDVNADGYADYLIGSPTTNHAYVFSGIDGSELWSEQGQTVYTEFGEAVAPAGDFNSDGHDDFLVAMGRGNIQLEPSAALYSGADGSILLTLENIRPDLAAIGGLELRGRALGGAFDINGDGVTDILSGAMERIPPPTFGFSETRRIVSGATGATLWKRWTEFPEFIANARILGDLDQDGYADWGLIIQRNQDVGPDGARIYRGGPGDALRTCAAEANSTGETATLDLPFGLSIQGTYFRLRALDVPPDETGIFFCGDAIPLTPFGDGNLCTGGSVQRLPPVLSSPEGAAWLDADVTLSPTAGFLPGTVRRFQYWFRDPAGTVGFNLSDALDATFTSH